MNCECYKKLWLAAVMVAVATTLVVAMVVIATILKAIHWYHAVPYISSCVGSLG